MLNAGYDEWKAAEFPIDSASSSSTAPIVDPQEGYYLVSEQLLARLDVPAVQIVDIRTDADRADDLDGNMPPGQIPGSLRLPWSELYNADGHLRSASEIAASAESLGLETARETVLYGTFGVDTALSWLALRNAGFETVLSYDRGWAEWSMLPGAPREPIT